MKVHLKWTWYSSWWIRPDEQNTWCELWWNNGVNKLNLITTEVKEDVTCKRCIKYLKLNEQ